MNKLPFFLAIILFSFSFLNAQVIEFKDEIFKAKLLEANPSKNIAKDENDNQITIDTNNNGEIEVSEVLSVYRLKLNSSLITAVDEIKEFTNLKQLNCNDNQIKLLNLSENLALTNLQCYHNELTELDLSNNVNLDYLSCSNNKLTSLDVSNNTLLTVLWCSNNPIVSLNLKNGIVLWTTDFTLMDSIKYVCVDPEEYKSVDTQLKSFGYEFAINSYCSFNPGGLYNTISGKSLLCQDKVTSIPNLKYSITDGSITGTFMSNSKGEYSIPVSNGTHTITPQLPYYTISPESFEVTFSNDSETKIQDFCVTPIADKNDVEVNLSPFGTPARPGFDSEYKIIYKNNGTTTLSGSVSLSYFDDVLDYVSATQSPDAYNEYELVWNYSDLKPFETREIMVTFNVNSPMENPAVNSDDVLSFGAKILPVIDDEQSGDNSSWLRQNVVNSLDPNDKTCLEGTDVLEDMIDEFVHYRIRFENVGTFPAENIVVVDEIDESKFDLSTFIPIEASHDFETKITDNKIEFIFEGIQLSFDDATNDGYILFKIKTLPTLKLGDSFSNQASIFFDFNFPIITNNEITTIVEEHLGISDFEFNQELTLYPNPVQDRLYITSNSNAKVLSLTVYNLQGQLIQTVPEVTKMSFDVSNLSKGTYLVKVKTDKGVGVTKVVKE